MKKNLKHDFLLLLDFLQDKVLYFYGQKVIIFCKITEHKECRMEPRNHHSYQLILKVDDSVKQKVENQKLSAKNWFRASKSSNRFKGLIYKRAAREQDINKKSSCYIRIGKKKWLSRKS